MSEFFKISDKRITVQFSVIRKSIVHSFDPNAISAISLGFYTANKQISTYAIAELSQRIIDEIIRRIYDRMVLIAQATWREFENERLMEMIGQELQKVTTVPEELRSKLRIPQVTYARTMGYFRLATNMLNDLYEALLQSLKFVDFQLATQIEQQYSKYKSNIKEIVYDMYPAEFYYRRGGGAEWSYHGRPVWPFEDWQKKRGAHFRFLEKKLIDKILQKYETVIRGLPKTDIEIKQLGGEISAHIHRKRHRRHSVSEVRPARHIDWFWFVKIDKPSGFFEYLKQHVSELYVTYADQWGKLLDQIFKHPAVRMLRERMGVFVESGNRMTERHSEFSLITSSLDPTTLYVWLNIVPVVELVARATPTDVLAGELLFRRRLLEQTIASVIGTTPENTINKLSELIEKTAKIGIGAGWIWDALVESGIIQPNGKGISAAVFSFRLPEEYYGNIAVFMGGEPVSYLETLTVFREEDVAYAHELLSSLPRRDWDVPIRDLGGLRNLVEKLAAKLLKRELVVSNDFVRTVRHYLVQNDEREIHELIPNCSLERAIKIFVCYYKFEGGLFGEESFSQRQRLFAKKTARNTLLYMLSLYYCVMYDILWKYFYNISSWYKEVARYAITTVWKKHKLDTPIIINREVSDRALGVFQELYVGNIQLWADYAMVLRFVLERVIVMKALLEEITGPNPEKIISLIGFSEMEQIDREVVKFLASTTLGSVFAKSAPSEVWDIIRAGKDFPPVVRERDPGELLRAFIRHPQLSQHERRSTVEVRHFKELVKWTENTFRLFSSNMALLCQILVQGVDMKAYYDVLRLSLSGMVRRLTPAHTVPYRPTLVQKDPVVRMWYTAIRKFGDPFASVIPPIPRIMPQIFPSFKTAATTWDVQKFIRDYVAYQAAKSGELQGRLMAWLGKILSNSVRVIGSPSFVTEIAEKRKRVLIRPTQRSIYSTWDLRIPISKIQLPHGVLVHLIILSNPFVREAVRGLRTRMVLSKEAARLKPFLRGIDFSSLEQLVRDECKKFNDYFFAQRPLFHQMFQTLHRIKMDATDWYAYKRSQNLVSKIYQFARLWNTLSRAYGLPSGIARFGYDLAQHANRVCMLVNSPLTSVMAWASNRVIGRYLVSNFGLPYYNFAPSILTRYLNITLSRDVLSGFFLTGKAFAVDWPSFLYREIVEEVL